MRDRPFRPFAMHGADGTGCGAGSVDGGDLAREFGAPWLFIPRDPGLQRAFRLLAMDLRYDLARTRTERAPNCDIAEIAPTMQRLQEEVDARSESEWVEEPRRERRAAPSVMFHRGGWLEGDAPHQAPIRATG